PYALEPPKLGDRFANGFVLLNEWNHAVFRLVQGLRLLEHVRGFLLRHNHDAIHIRNDNVSWANLNACAGHSYITACEAVMIHGSRWHNPAAENGKLQLRDLWRVTQAAVDHRSSEAAILHRGTHQPANAGVVQTILEDHHIHRARPRLVNGVQHPLLRLRSFLMFFFRQQHRDGPSCELALVQGPHVVGHVGFLTVELLHGVSHRGRFDQPESLDEISRIAG